jgi:hypothetical protein
MDSNRAEYIRFIQNCREQIRTIERSISRDGEIEQRIGQLEIISYNLDKCLSKL